MLWTSDGRRVGRLDPVFKEGLPVREAQVVQESLTRFRIRYVPAPDYAASAGRSMVERLRARVGEADVVLTLSSELIGVPGITLLGPFPAALQQHVIFTAARGATASASDAAAADRLLQTLSAPDVVATLADHGLEPPGPPR